MTGTSASIPSVATARHGKPGVLYYPTVHFHLGLAYEKTDQPALARQHFERGLKINPNYAEAAEVKKHRSTSLS